MVQRIPGIRYSQLGVIGKSVDFAGISLTHNLVHPVIEFYQGFQHWALADMQSTSSATALKVGAFYFDASEISSPPEVYFRAVFASSTGSLSASIYLRNQDTDDVITTLNTSLQFPQAISASVTLDNTIYVVEVATEGGNEIVVGSVELFISGTTS